MSWRLQETDKRTLHTMPQLRDRSAAIRVATCLLLTLSLFASGCSQPTPIDTGYGARRGAKKTKSVNGTGVLAHMFEQAGHRVYSWGKLSPRLERSDAIVWIPDDFSTPTSEQIRFLENWIMNEPARGRTLVYVGRDYDASVDYWNDLLPQVAPANYPVAKRQQARALVDFESQRRSGRPQGTTDWFRFSDDNLESTKPQLSGPWAKGLVKQETNLRWEKTLEFPQLNSMADGISNAKTDVDNSEDDADSESEDFDDDYATESSYRVSPLLRVNDDIFAAKVSRSHWSAGSVIVIANGSFLLNYPLINKQHRILAGRLIEHLGEPKEIAFLESGPGGLPISQDQAAVATWLKLLTIWPMNAVLYHLILLGILFCFAVFPIFGRPHEPVEDAVSDFGKHVDALGKMLERTGDRDYATDRLRHYQELVEREANEHSSKQ